MSYLLFGAILSVLLFISIQYSKKRKAQKQLNQIRSAWGNTKKELFNFNNIIKYKEAIKDNHYHLLSQQTIDDIDFYKLFELIDRTSSKVGQQFLFSKLITPTNLEKDPLQNLIEIFSTNTTLREATQLQLIQLNDSDAYHIVSLLKDDLLEPPKWFKLLKMDIVIVICLLILSLKFHAFILFLIVPFSINLFLHLWNKNNAFQFVRSIPQLNLLIEVAKSISLSNENFKDQAVKESIANLKKFQRKSAIINFDKGTGIQSELFQVVTYLWELVKAFLLIEVFALFNAVKELERKQSSIITLFNFIGKIDTAIAIASLRAGKLKTCQPIFSPAEKKVVVKKMYHPLIENCVDNDLSINGKSILITGSNMSGKSTFLRAFTINSILAQTIYTCFAEEFQSPVLKQFSSIRIDDNIFQGKSYYLQEVATMADLIAEVPAPQQNLFVLDEVFKGTNTIERIAAAKAILSYLNHNNNIVIIATHDIELADMLDHEYDLYHFAETIENDELCFDHKIKSGQLKTRNAIKILELANYPVEIINEAKQISMTLGLVKNTN